MPKQVCLVLLTTVSLFRHTYIGTGFVHRFLFALSASPQKSKKKTSAAHGASSLAWSSAAQNAFYDKESLRFLGELRSKTCSSPVRAASGSTLSARTTIFFFFFCTRIYFPASGQAVVTGVVPSPPRFLPSIFIAHRVQQSHCSSSFSRVLLTHALAFSASQFVRKKKCPRIYTSMRSGRFELTEPAYTPRLEDNLIRHRGGHLTNLVLGFSMRIDVQGGLYPN